jgi:phage tail-like protein
MARSTTEDPIDKWRFRVTVLNITAGPAGLLQNAIASTFLRSGFTYVKLPEKTTKELQYRESGDPEQVRKQGGLTAYSDCILRRGTTENQDFYRWSSLVKGDTQFQSIVAEVAGSVGINTSQYPVSNSLSYRKDIIIDVIGRSNATRKSWYLYNCWVKEYKPGDVNSTEEIGMYEEIVLACELMSELSADKSESILTELNELGSIGIASINAALNLF